MQQIRAASLTSYLAVAASVGIDGLRMLAEVGISPSALENLETRLPAKAATRLLERSAELSHCDSFGLRMAEQRTFASLGAISLLLERLPTVGDVLEALSTSGRAFSDVIAISVEQHNGSVSARFHVIPPFNRDQASDLCLGMGYIALSGASHRLWQPEVVHITHAEPKDRAAFQRFFQAPIEFNSSFSGFSFASTALAIALPLADPAMAAHARRLLKSVALPTDREPMSAHLRQIITVTLPEGRATLEEVARSLDMTPRMVQRLLRLENLTFAQVLNQVRRDLARHDLRTSPKNLIEIAQGLGYANSSSFTRWFAHEFGMAPSAWRKAQRRSTAGPPPIWQV